MTKIYFVVTYVTTMDAPSSRNSNIPNVLVHARDLPSLRDLYLAGMTVGVLALDESNNLIIH